MYKVTFNNNRFTPSSRLLEKEKLIEGETYNIDLIKDVRSLAQNRYLWKIFQLIADWYNNGNENAGGEYFSSEKAKAKILYEIGHADFYLTTENGMMYGVIKETRKLTKKEFSDLTEKIIQTMALKGLQILTPEEFFEKLNY